MINSAKHSRLFSDLLCQLSLWRHSGKNITSLYTENRYKSHRLLFIVVSNSDIYITYKYCTQIAAVSVSGEPVNQAIKKRRVWSQCVERKYSVQSALHVQICVSRKHPEEEAARLWTQQLTVKEASKENLAAVKHQ